MPGLTYRGLRVSGGLYCIREKMLTIPVIDYKVYNDISIHLIFIVVGGLTYENHD